ncbi:MAG: alanine racemase, partial [Bacteroidota bacterium]|nr:alanine racemase [Bacteroidota bacterium]
MQEIGAAWTSVREAVPDHVTVVAVSKTKPVEAVVAAHAAGARVFGENRVQELVGKHEALTHPDAPCHGDYPDLHWHQIGTLQRNKVKYIAPFVSLIHAVDQVALLDEIDKRAAAAGRRIQLLLQVHIAEEQTKFGFGAEDLPAVCDRLDAGDWGHVEV